MKSKVYTFALWACIALFLSANFNLGAQSMYQVDPFEAAASPFTELDSTELTTGLLAERGNPFFSLYNYSLNLPHNDSLVLDVSGLQMAGVTAWSMAYDSSDVAWMGDRWYKDRQRDVSDTLFLGGLVVQYDQFDGDALTNNLVTLDTIAGKVYDVPNRTQSPYVLDTAVLMSVLTQKPAGEDVVFYLDSRDLLSNVAGLAVSGLRVNGQKFDFGLDTALNYTFPSSDTFAISLELSDGSSVYNAHGVVVVPPPARPMARMMTGDSLIVPIDGGGGDIRIYYSGNCGNTLSKTIIFVGGLDPENSRNYHDVTLPKLLYPIIDTDTDYDGTTPFQQLIDNDFDIIFVDWADGAASLGTNAAVVANAIQTINRLKAEDGDYSKSIIVGQSMAGLCVRAGIHMLDSMQIDPLLEMFFSWDSPHRGANYPASMQAMLVYFGKSRNLRKWVDKLDRAWEAHHSAASRQLKLFHIGEEGELTTAAFDAWQAYYQSFDISVPHYAMSNGSGTNNQLSSTPAASRVVLPGSFILRADKVTQTTPISNTVLAIQAEYLPGNFEISHEFYLFGQRLFDIDLAHSRDISQALPNYDIIPASISNVGIGEAAATAPTGRVDEPWWLALLTPRSSFNILIPGLYYAYVPTQSGQNLPVSLTPSLGTAGFDTEGGVVSRSELIEVPPAFQGPTSSHNHDHVTFTPQLVVFFLDRVLGADLSVPLPQVSQFSIDRTYNFGAEHLGRSTPTKIGGNLTLTSTGSILVNHSGRIFYVDDPNPLNHQIHFSLALSDGNCNTPLADITLQSGAEFIVGQDENRTATVTALPGTRVTVQSGAKLEMNNNSDFILQSAGPEGTGGVVIEGGGLVDARFAGQLIVDGGILRIKAGGAIRTTDNGNFVARNGGKIILEDGALVQLWDGDNPESDGNIHIDNGGILNIEGEYTYSGSGYFRFSPGNTVKGPGALRIEGDGKDFRRMVVDASARVTLNDQDFVVRDAKVEYGSGSSVHALDGSEIDVRIGTFKGFASEALHSDGAAIVNIRYADFIDCGDGVVLDPRDSNDGTSAFSILGSTFTDCQNGVGLFNVDNLSLAASTPNVSQTTFKDCDAGVLIEGAISVNIDNSTFTSIHEGSFAVDATDGQVISMTNCSVTDYEGGKSHGAIYLLNNGLLAIEGGLYANNSTAIFIDEATDVSLGGCVDLINNATGILSSLNPGGNSALTFDGATVTGNNIAVDGKQFIISSTSANTFGLGTGLFLKLEQSGPIPMNLNGNLWTPASSTLQGIPNDDLWFCIKPPTGSGCQDNAVVVSTHSSGCGSDCVHPETCPEFCDYFPNDPLCEIKPGGGGEVGRQGFSIYPNPSNGLTILAFEKADSGELAVFDVQGRQVMKLPLGPSTYQEIDFSQLTIGMYLLQMIGDSGEIFSQRLRIAR